MSAPDAAGAALPTQAQLAEVVKTASARRPGAYVDTVTSQALMNAPPPRGSIVRTTERPEAGITEWTLSNGATVVLKPTALKADQILFRAVAPGGTSLASDADFRSARVADDAVRAGGVGAFSVVTLEKMLAEKAVAWRPSSARSMKASGRVFYTTGSETCSSSSICITQPPDPTAFAAIVGQSKAFVSRGEPGRRVQPDHRGALSGNHLRRQPETPSTIDQWNLPQALAFYRARFADASNFTFVFVGSFTIDAIRPLVETYIASLPATHAKETWRDVGIAPPSGKIEKTINMGIAPKSNVAILLSAPFQYDASHKLAMRAVTMLLQSRLFDTFGRTSADGRITANFGSRNIPGPSTRSESSGRAIRPGPNR